MRRDLPQRPGVVFAAWTDPHMLAQWWGPNGFTNPVCDLDARPGGAFRIVMRAPDGEEYPLKGVYREVSPAKLVFTDDWSEHPAEWFVPLNDARDAAGAVAPEKEEAINVVTFEPGRGGSTRLTIRSFFQSAVDRDAMMKMGMRQGWAESLDRLQALLARVARDSAEAPSPESP